MHTATVKESAACLPNKADMFWKSLSSSGVIAGLFSNVTSLRRDGGGNGDGENAQQDMVRGTK